MPYTTVSTAHCFGGTQGFYRHPSRELGVEAGFAVFVPPQAATRPVPVVWFLAGLTCTEENFTVKAGAQRVAAELGLMLVAPDTSPRGATVPDDPAYDLGQGAGFYLDATEAPWAANFRMESWLTAELPELVGAHFPADMHRQGVAGHSMGGHGALTLALRHPNRFRSVSAFAPIVAPSAVPWGQKAFTAYLGEDRARWREHDACALIQDGRRLADLLVDQGEADPFLHEQLRPEVLAEACARAGIPLTLRCHPGYDHSYYFIATFIADHLHWHAQRLR